MATKKDEGLPVAIATEGGLLATLAVLLIGTANGMRAWVLLVKAGIAFLLVSGILRLVTAAALQFIRLKADNTEPENDSAEEVQQTAAAISSAATSPEPLENLTS